MSKVKIELDKAGMTKLLQSEPIKELTAQKANEMVSGHPHHHVRTFVGFDRAKSIIYPNTTRYPK